MQSRHVVVSLSLEADVMEAIAGCEGSGADGGKGKDKVKVKRRIVIDVPAASWHVPDSAFLLSFAL